MQIARISNGNASGMRFQTKEVAIKRPFDPAKATESAGKRPSMSERRTMRMQGVIEG